MDRWTDGDEEGPTEEEEEAGRDAVRAINEEEGRKHPDIGKAKWEANRPQYSESEIDW